MVASGVQACTFRTNQPSRPAVTASPSDSADSPLSIRQELEKNRPRVTILKLFHFMKYTINPLCQFCRTEFSIISSPTRKGSRSLVGVSQEILHHPLHHGVANVIQPPVPGNRRLDDAPFLEGRQVLADHGLWLVKALPEVGDTSRFLLDQTEDLPPDGMAANPEFGRPLFQKNGITGRKFEDQFRHSSNIAWKLYREQSVPPFRRPRGTAKMVPWLTSSLPRFSRASVIRCPTKKFPRRP